MDENVTLVDETEVKKEKIGKYIVGMILCGLPLLFNALILDAFMIVDFLLPYVMPFSPAAVSLVHIIIGGVFAVIIPLAAIYPLVVAIKSKLFSFKKNKVGMITAICLSLAWVIVNPIIFGVGFLIETMSAGRIYAPMLGLITTVCDLVPLMIGVVSLFLFVLMTFGLFKAIKNNKNISN